MILQTRPHTPAKVYCDVTAMKNIDFPLDVACKNAHPVAGPGVLLAPLESEMLEIICSLRDL